jgi:Alginate lyase
MAKFGHCKISGVGYTIKQHSGDFIVSIASDFLGREMMALRKMIISWVGSLLVIGTVYSGEKKFQHPSIFSLQADLAALRTRVTNPVIAPAYEKLKASKYASLSRPHTPYATVKVVGSGTCAEETAYRSDACAAHETALMWVITGDKRYCEKSKAILNDWAKTYQTLESKPSSQTQLEAAWNVPVWVAAADILRYYDKGSANWKAEEVAAFDSFLVKQVKTACGAKNRNNNWGTSATLAIMCAAVYQEDEAAYHEAITLFRKQLQDISKPSGALGPDYLRDPWHPQYTILTWIQTCELAWNQGDDLYGTKLDKEELPRLAICLEHFSKLFLGKLPNPKGLQKGDYRGGQLGRQGYEMAYNHYIKRQDLAKYLPTFTTMVPAWRPGGVDSHFVGWDMLTHGLIDNKGSVVK